MRYGYILLLLLGIILFNNQSVEAQETAEVVNERIMYIKPDGVNYMQYWTQRSNYLSCWVGLEKGLDVETHYEYIQPKDYIFQDNPDEAFNQLHFDQGSFALMWRGNFGKNVYIDEEGVYTFRNDSIPDSQGYYGFYSRPNGFKEFVYVWVLPDNFEFVSYNCSQEGEWVKKGSTLSYYGRGQNNLLFTIRYQPIENVPSEVEGRAVNITRTIKVKHPNIKIMVWDDNEEDGDIISLRVNDQWLLQNMSLKNKKSQLHYQLSKSENYLLLHAINLGKIPPNTAAVTIDDGELIQRFVLSANFGESQGVKIQYVGE